MIENNFLKDYFIISSIHNKMNNLLKNILIKNNISINETQLMILFLLHGKQNLSAQELLLLGQFNMSNLIFNISHLGNEDLLDFQDNSSLQQRNSKINISENGQVILKNINKICDSLKYDSSFQLFAKYFENKKISNNQDFYNTLDYYNNFISSLNEKKI